MESSQFLLNELSQTDHDLECLFNKLKNQFRINFQKYGKEDLRCGFFVVSFELFLWLMINRDHFLDLCKNKTFLDKHIENTFNDYQEFLVSYNTITRTSFLMRIIFNVEDFMRSVLVSLEEKPQNRFFQLSKQYLTKLNYFSDYRHKILMLPAEIRNSNHNGGFTSRPIDVTIGNIEFKAEAGERITFFDWKRTFIVLDAMFDLIIETIPLLGNISVVSSTYAKLWKENPLE